MSGGAPSRSLGSLVRATAVVFASSVTVMAVGLLKNVLAAYYFGTSGDMDCYLLALLLPDMTMQLARTGAFNFIPLFAAERQRGEREAWGAAGKMLTYWLALLLVALVLAFAVSPQAVALLAPGFSAALQAQTLSFTWVLFLMAGAVGVARILGVTLHAERRFLAVGASEAIFQIVSVLYLVAFHEWGIESLVWSQVVGGFAQLLATALGLWKRRRLIRPVFDLRASPVRRMIRLTLPVYLGDSGDKINLMVTRGFASLLPAGAVSALQYAFTLVEGLHTLLAGALVTTLFPYLSQRFAQREERGARLSLHRAAVFTAIVFLPMAAGTWLAAEPLVVLLFERGSFDVASTDLTASALRLFAPGLVALGLNSLLGAMFHARQDTLTPMSAGFVRVAFNIALCAALAPSLGHRGIALATSVALYAKLAFLLNSLRRRMPNWSLGVTVRALARVVPAVLLMTLVVYPVAALARIPQVLEEYALTHLLVIGLLGLSAYAGGLWLFCRRELVFYLALVHRTLLRSVRLRHGRVGSAPDRGNRGGEGVSSGLRARTRRTVARAMSIAGPDRGRGLRVLTYHRVNASHPHDRLSVHPRAFADQLEELERSGHPVVSLEEGVAALRAGLTPGGKRVAITFDDGYEDNFSVALPLLERFGFRATFFLATAYLGSGSTIERYSGCCDGDAMLDWHQVRELLAGGHAVGGHGRWHRELALLAPELLRDEVEGSARDIERATGQRARLFCYPRGSENARVRRAVADAGYEAACTVKPGANLPAQDPLALRRTEISGDDGLADFRLKLSGGFDTWHRLVQLLPRGRRA